ncbi:MAG: response regulator [Pseudomonadota bacterium]
MSNTKKRNILIVDDSATIRIALRKQLEKFGINVTEAEDGEAGFETALSGAFDLIVSDVEMPKMNGFELCSKLKNHKKTEKIPVVMFTSRDADLDVEKGFSSGADAYISKAHDMKDAVDTIQGIFNRLAFQRNQTILVVDDSPTIRAVVEKGLIESGFQVITAENGATGLSIARDIRPNLILSDIDMPVMNGKTFCKIAHEDPVLSTIPFVMMSTNSQRPIIRQMMQYGAVGYLVKPFNIEQLIVTIEKLLSDQFLLLLKEKERLDTEQKMMLASITSLIQALEARDIYTRGHSDSVSAIVVSMGVQLRISNEDMETLELGSKLHDLGKIGVPDSILLKAGKLTNMEFMLLKRHPTIGAKILSPIQRFDKIIPIVMYHHERIDGNGYPEGLKGDEIPFWARMTAVADTYHAITSDRPYRKGLPHETALQIITEATGTQLCPESVEIFLKSISF